MKLFRNILKSLSASLVIALVMLVVSTATASAATNPAGPKFNFFTDAPGIGVESDFLRIQKADGSRVNTLEQCEGDVNMWFYVHNSQAAANNGTNYNGVGVARDTRLRVQMPTGYGNSREMKAFVSASNATTVSDGASITCGGSQISLSYVDVTEIYTTAPEGYELIGDLTSPQGARLALKGHAGDIMPGCWDHRVRLSFKVKINKKPKPVIGTGICKVTEVAILNNTKREVEASVSGVTTGQGVTIVGYQINWGDNSTPSDKQNDTHTYAKEGTYVITGKIQLKFTDGTTKWVDSPECTRTVTFKPGQPPVVPPVTPTVVPPTSGKLPETGVNAFGIFATVSMVGAFLHRAYKARKLTV